MRPATQIISDDSDDNDDKQHKKMKTVDDNFMEGTSTSKDQKIPKSKTVPVSETPSKFYKEANEVETKKAHALMEIANQLKEANKIKKNKLELLKEQNKHIQTFSESLQVLLSQRFSN